jgi:hypothetical protein
MSHNVGLSLVIPMLKYLYRDPVLHLVKPKKWRQPMSNAMFFLLLLVVLPTIWIIVFIIRRGFGNFMHQNRRAQAIKEKKFGKFERDVIDRKVKVGMTGTMVLTAWGKPSFIDNQKETRKYKEMRLVYGNPDDGSGANFVTLRDGVVTKVTVNQPYRAPKGVIKPGFIVITILFLVWGLLFCALSATHGHIV